MNCDVHACSPEAVIKSKARAIIARDLNPLILHNNISLTKIINTWKANSVKVFSYDCETSV
jgi:hypothetical protein